MINNNPADFIKHLQHNPVGQDGDVKCFGDKLYYTKHI